METRAHYLMVGSFVVSSFIALIVFILWMAKHDFNDKFKLYEIFFEGSVTGLRINEDVRYHGIPIGNVKSISVDKKNINRVRVRISVRKPALIREDTIASIEAQGLTGYTYIQIQGGTQESPLLKAKAGERYPVIQSQPSKIELLFSNAPVILSNLAQLSEKLNITFNDENQAHIRAILDNIHKVSDQLAGGAGSVESTLKEFKQTLQDVRQLMVRNKDAVENFTVMGLPELSKLVVETKEMVTSIKQVAEGLNHSTSAFLNRSSGKGYEIQ